MEPEEDNPSCSVTDLLALRLSSVPFHDVDQSQAIANQTSTNADGHHTIDRWVPQVTTISFVGPLEPLHERRGVFKSAVSLMKDDGSPNTSIWFPLILLPSTIIVGKLPDHSSPLPSTGISSWLISGELCLMSGDFTIVAQSLYRVEGADNNRNTSQVSFTGYVSSLVTAEHVTWVWTNVKTKASSIEEALKVAAEPDAWHSAEICSRVRVSLADLEWLDVSTEIGEKSLEDPSGWIHGGRELISVKCRPSKTKEDHTRMIEYATTVPLVGQLIAIDLSDDNQMKTIFIQL